MDNKLKLPDYTLVTEPDFYIISDSDHTVAHNFRVIPGACWPCCASLDADREKNVQQSRNYTMRPRSTAFFIISYAGPWQKPSS
jgi:hypothetical protein